MVVEPIEVHRVPIQNFSIQAEHQGCGGQMKFTGSTDASEMGKKHLHRCEGCGEIYLLDSEYPRVEWKEIK